MGGLGACNPSQYSKLNNTAPWTGLNERRPQPPKSSTQSYALECMYLYVSILLHCFPLPLTICLAQVL